MRALPLASFCLVSLISLGLATDSRAEDSTETRGLIVFSDRQAAASNDGGPTVLRGSAVKRGTVEGAGSGGRSAGFQIGAGEQLWFTDTSTGQVIVCDDRRTSTVGSRFIGCIEDRLPFTISE